MWPYLSSLNSSLKPSNANPNCFTPETQAGFPASLPGAVLPRLWPLQSAFSSQVSAVARRVSLCSWKFFPDLAPSAAEGNPPALALPEIAFTVLFFFFERFILVGNEGGDHWDRGKPRSNSAQAVNNEGGCSGCGQETKILGRATRIIFKKKTCGWWERKGRLRGQETPQHLQAPWGTGQRMEVREAQPLCWHGCPVDPQHGVLGALGALWGAGSCPPGIANEPQFGGEVPAAYQHRLSFNI